MQLTQYMAYIIILLILSSIGFSVINGSIAVLCTFVISTLIFIIALKTDLFYVTKRKLIISILLFLLFLWHGRDNNIIGFSGIFIQTFSFSIVLFLNKNIQNEVINKLIRIFVWISGISLLFWVLYLLGIYNLSWGTINFSDVYLFKNYLFFICPEDGVWPRFQCVFVEPGAYGLYCIIILLFNKFKRDRYSLILLLSVAFTLSLASYIILVFILFYKFIVVKSRSLLHKLIPFILCTGIYIVGINYNSGDNIFYEAILFRLKLNENNEMIGYNRTTDDFEHYFETKVKGKSLIFGIGSKLYSTLQFEDSVDYKAFIALDGLLGLFIFCLLYFYILKSFPINKDTILAVSIFILIFYRGFVLAFNPGTMMLLYLSVSYLSHSILLHKNNSLNYRTNE